MGSGDVIHALLHHQLVNPKGTPSCGLQLGYGVISFGRLLAGHGQIPGALLPQPYLRLLLQSQPTHCNVSHAGDLRPLEDTFQEAETPIWAELSVPHNQKRACYVRVSSSHHSPHQVVYHCFVRCNCLHAGTYLPP